MLRLLCYGSGLDMYKDGCLDVVILGWRIGMYVSFFFEVRRRHHHQW